MLKQKDTGYDYFQDRMEMEEALAALALRPAGDWFREGDLETRNIYYTIDDSGHIHSVRLPVTIPGYPGENGFATFDTESERIEGTMYADLSDPHPFALVSSATCVEVLQHYVSTAGAWYDAEEVTTPRTVTPAIAAAAMKGLDFAVCVLESGWCQDAMAMRDDGNEVGYDDADAAAWCLSAALNRASREVTGLDDTDRMTVCDVMEDAVRRQIIIRHPDRWDAHDKTDGVLLDYNDQVAVDLQEVLDVVRDARQSFQF